MKYAAVGSSSLHFVQLPSSSREVLTNYAVVQRRDYKEEEVHSFPNHCQNDTSSSARKTFKCNKPVPIGPFWSMTYHCGDRDNIYGKQVMSKKNRTTINRPLSANESCKESDEVSWKNSHHDRSTASNLQLTQIHQNLTTVLTCLQGPLNLGLLSRDKFSQMRCGAGDSHKSHTNWCRSDEDHPCRIYWQRNESLQKELAIASIQPFV